MTDRFNTIAGWVLFAGIIALGGSIVSGEVFSGHRPETMGYPIPGVVAEGEGEVAAEKPIACYLAAADPAKGQTSFAKCSACHNAEPGGANALGPALYGVLGNPVAAHPGYAFSEPLKSKGGTWDFETMSAWLANPKGFAQGTKMTFAGLSNPEERANIIAFLNSRDASPLPLPAAGPECADDAAAAGAPAAASNAVAPTTGDASTPAQGGSATPAGGNALGNATAANPPTGQKAATGGEQQNNQ
ncbi:MAG: cytochrome c family protein [Pseudomonadota bacterium]|nr:cytochrome c family protein [Pseudomonadota bacterium]